MIDQIITKITEIKESDKSINELILNENKEFGSNEMLLFLKPELVNLESKKLHEVLNMILGKLESFKIQIHAIRGINAAFLEEFSIMAQHYGVINKLAQNPQQNLTENAKVKFKEKTGKEIADVTLLGGLEFIKNIKGFSPFSLDILWQNSENFKLAGGTYCEELKIDGKSIYVVNGFHPRQLTHFTDSGNAILAFHVSTENDWSNCRQELIGSTDPSKASKSSIRGTLLENKSVYGLAEVSQGMNGIHLSAGPIEGIIELTRYMGTNKSEDSINNITEFDFGKTLKESFTVDALKKIITNSDIEISENTFESVFDLTEEKNTKDSLEILSKLL